MIPPPDPPSPVPSSTLGPFRRAPVAKARAVLKPARSLFSTFSTEPAAASWEAPPRVVIIFDTSASPPNDIPPSPTTKAGEKAPRLMLRGREVTEVAAKMVRIVDR